MNEEIRTIAAYRSSRLKLIPLERAELLSLHRENGESR